MEAEPSSQQSAGIDRILIPGILAGLAASVPMALFSMVASLTYQGRGLFSPFYLITSILGDDTIFTSLRLAERGNAYLLVAEPIVFGVVMHLMVGSFFGAVFAVIAQKVPPGKTIPVAVVYALLVMVLMVFVIVPLVDRVMGGDRFGDLATEGGLLTLVIQHVIYGLVLGWWPWLRPGVTRLGLRVAG